jgi:hypothetical protein
VQYLSVPCACDTCVPVGDSTLHRSVWMIAEHLCIRACNGELRVECVLASWIVKYHSPGKWQELEAYLYRDFFGCSLQG